MKTKNHINILKFLQDFNIPYATDENKHCRKGWVQIHCPFCSGTKNYHLGIKLPGIYTSCWRCKGKSIPLVVQKLLNCSWYETYQTIQKYNAETKTETKQQRTIKLPNKHHKIKLPIGTVELTLKHKRYLQRRKFDPEYLERTFKLKSTGPIGQYKHRIIAPIFLQENLISYQGRDITNKANLKYMACAESDEIYPHKHSLYGIDLAKKEWVVVVEGITDVWRLRQGSIATFGTSFTSAQVKMICARFKRVFLLFDAEDAAQKTAQKMGYMFSDLGMKVEILLLDENDPGSMEQDDADYLMRELG